jgi:hypothetical protein
MAIGGKPLFRVSVLTMLVTEAVPLLVGLGISVCFSPMPAACQALGIIMPFSIVVAILLNVATFLLGLLATGQARRWGWFAGVLLGTPLLILGDLLWLADVLRWEGAVPNPFGWLPVLSLLAGVILPLLPTFLASAFGLRGTR